MGLLHQGPTISSQVSGVEHRVSSLDSSRWESLGPGVCRPQSISISGLTGLEGDATELYSCSWWKCGVSGDEGCGVEGLVPHSKGVVRPSTDLYDLWRKRLVLIIM